jgi:hypothetical protein
MAPILIKVTIQGANYKQNHLNGNDAEVDDTAYCIYCVVTPSPPQNMPETRLTLNTVVAVLLHSHISLYPRLGPAPTITVC